MVTPLAAADTAAPRTEWALKISVFIPDFVSTDLIHLAMVDEATGLYGLMIAVKSCDLLLSFQLLLVLSLAFLVSTKSGHWAKYGNEGKKNSVNAFDCFDCLVNFVGANVTPSGLYFLWVRFRSADLEGRVNAISITVL